RLRPGVSQAQARAELNSIAEPYWISRMGDETKAAYLSGKAPMDQRVVLDAASRGFTALRARFSEALQGLMGLVAIVLLIACANVANLMLARANARQKEIGIRLAIGASRGRLVRQLLTESLMLSAAGGALGVVFALWSSRLLIRMLPSGPVPPALEVALDYRLLGFALALSMATGILFGLVP